jgi:hypothetical protein
LPLLQELDEEIKQQLEEGDCADPEYWEAVRRRLKVYLAKARLREIHFSLQERHRAAQEANLQERMKWGGGGEEEKGTDHNGKVNRQHTGGRGRVSRRGAGRRRNYGGPGVGYARMRVGIYL